MVYPSLACHTCKSRRVKCDFVRPRCGRCKKACRDCTWSEQDGVVTAFRSENVFAQGQPRRPRGPNAPASQLIATSKISIRPTMRIPLEIQALNYWMRNYTFSLDELPEFGQEYFSHVVPHWNIAQPDSSLRLALGALSLATFGKARREKPAIEEARKLYAKGIEKTALDVAALSNDKVDQVIVATMLLGLYENIMYSPESHISDSDARIEPDDMGTRLWRNVCHHKGASGIIKLRKERGLEPSLALDRTVRRQILRTCMLRGRVIPRWLLNGAEYGESDCLLELDSLMIQTADLRAKLLVFLGKRGPLPIPDCEVIDVNDIANEAEKLELALESWARSLPEDWGFSAKGYPAVSKTVTNDEHLLEWNAHAYTTVSHAAAWNRYRAIRIVVNAILIRATRAPVELFWSDVSAAHTQHEVYHNTIASLARDMCGGVEFIFVTDQVPISYERISPRMAILLAWILTVAVSTEFVPRPERAWLRRRLEVVAKSFGDAVLESVVQEGEFKF